MMPRVVELEGLGSSPVLVVQSVPVRRFPAFLTLSRFRQTRQRCYERCCTCLLAGKLQLWILIMRLIDCVAFRHPARQTISPLEQAVTHQGSLVCLPETLHLESVVGPLCP